MDLTETFPLSLDPNNNNVKSTPCDNFPPKMVETYPLQIQESIRGCGSLFYWQICIAMITVGGVYYGEDKTQATLYLLVHGGLVLTVSLIWCVFGFPSNRRINLEAIGVVIGIFFLLWGTVGIFGKFSNWYEAESPNDKYYCPSGPFLFAFVINITNWIATVGIVYNHHYNRKSYREYEELV